MSEALQQFHFLRPWWLLALCALPLLIALAVRRDGARDQLSRLVDAELLPFLLKGNPVRRRATPWLLAGGWALVTLAMAGPSWSRVAQPLYAKRAAQVVAVSMSQRMLARDVTPSRLDRARYKVRDLMASNHDGLNALIAYAGEAFVVAPLTSDGSALNDLLAALSPDTMPVDGDDAAKAIERGVGLIHDAKAGGGSLVLVTDDADAAAQAAARKALADGVRVSVLGIGTSQGGPVPLSDNSFQRDEQGGVTLARRNDDALRALAASGGGQYVPMTDDDRDIRTLDGELRASGPATLAADLHGDEWQDRGPWLLLALLPLAAASFRRGWLTLLALAMWPAMPGAAQASTWSDLWRRPDQQAATALQQGDAKRAEQLARDPALRGAAAYRAGDYAAAGNQLRPLPGTDAQYNLGNALAKQGDYQGALDAYDRSLKADPKNADALANRKAVEDWMRKLSQLIDLSCHRPRCHGLQLEPQAGDLRDGSLSHCDALSLAVAAGRAVHLGACDGRGPCDTKRSRFDHFLAGLETRGESILGPVANGVHRLRRHHSHPHSHAGGGHETAAWHCSTLHSSARGDTAYKG